VTCFFLAAKLAKGHEETEADVSKTASNYRVISRSMHRESSIAKLTNVQQTVEQLLAEL
jgi:hypothetical protein